MTSEHYGGFDPLGLSYTLHVATRIEKPDDERCVGCYPEESGCTGAASIRELSRDVSLSIPQAGGSRVVPLNEIQGLDFERVLSIVLAVELIAGDSFVARDTLAPVWARCC